MLPTARRLFSTRATATLLSRWPRATTSGAAEVDADNAAAAAAAADAASESTSHRGIGAVDEGVDGLREAGFLDDHAARSMAHHRASPHDRARAPALAPPAQMPDGASNVYAIDDEYKEMAFAVLRMTEQDFGAALHAHVTKARETAPAVVVAPDLPPDAAITAPRVANPAAALDPDPEAVRELVEESFTDPIIDTIAADILVAEVSPAARIHASVLSAVASSDTRGAEWETTDSSMSPLDHHQIDELMRQRVARQDPSAPVPGSRRSAATSDNAQANSGAPAGHGPRSAKEHHPHKHRG
ncbi:hypothetical protein GGF32_007112 [Allomyces javanicus]|nr:hypothetical protein GGF32_007112 [Allomyces javanicus]